MRTFFIICLIIFATVAMPAQDNKSDGKAAVYVYAYTAGVVLGGVKKTVYVNDKMVADISPERYFIVLLEPGKHSLHFDKKKYGGIEKEFKANTVYYLRVGWEVGATVKPAGLLLVPEENGAFDVKQLKPIDKNRVKSSDYMVVFDLQ